MNTTIAVALITAISTLAGAAIAGRVTLAATRVQAENQLALAGNNLKAQDAQEKKQVRRDIYVKFLTKVSSIQDKLSIWWSYPPSPITQPMDVIGPFQADINELAGLLNLVIIEGPEDVGEAANKLYLRLALEIPAVAMQHIEKDDKGLERFTYFSKETAAARNKMITVVRDALG